MKEEWETHLSQILHWQQAEAICCYHRRNAGKKFTCLRLLPQRRHSKLTCTLDPIPSRETQDFAMDGNKEFWKSSIPEIQTQVASLRGWSRKTKKPSSPHYTKHHIIVIYYLQRAWQSRKAAEIKDFERKSGALGLSQSIREWQYPRKGI